MTNHSYQASSFLLYIYTSSSARFGASLRHLEMPMDVITHPVLHELAAKCPNLTSIILDFSTAMQLHDFNDMQVSLIYISEVDYRWFEDKCLETSILKEFKSWIGENREAGRELQT